MNTPWHKRYHSDALTGYRGLNLEQRGAYTTILDLLYDSGDEALTASERWMAGQLDVSARKWRGLRDELAALGKITVLDDGRITNARYLRERSKSATLSAKRAEAGRKGGQASPSQQSLPLENDAENDANSAEFSTFSTPENELSGKDNSGERDEKPRETNGRGQASASILPPLRAREPDTRSQKLEREESTPPPTNPMSAPGDDDDGDRFDLLATTNRLARLGGVAINPAYPQRLTRELDIVKGWIADGVDLEQTAVPVITEKLQASADDSIGSLRFYDGAVRKAHAKTTGPKKPVKPSEPDRNPMRVQDADDPRIVDIRDRLRTSIGARTYENWMGPKVTALSVNGVGLVVTAKTPFNAEWIEANLQHRIEQTAQAVLGSAQVKIRPQ